MNAVILAPGSRGDVQPYIALGQALRAQGHACTIVTTEDHERLVLAYGLNVATIPINVGAELRRAETRRAVEGGGVLASFAQFVAIAKRAARALAEVGLEASRDADLVVTNFGTVLVADGIAKKRNVPLVQAYNVPVTATSAFPGALFPSLDQGGLLRRLGHALTRVVLWTTARAAAKEACAEVLGAKPARLLPGREAGLLPGAVLYGFSDAFLPRPADWPQDARVTGFWFVEEPTTFAPPVPLEQFLDEGPPPVALGFGSMGVDDPKAVSALVLEAARSTGTRLVLQAGWAGLAPQALSRDVIAVGDVPHAWLYPRCRAVVHHGGAGTTAAAARAGVPAVVVPFHGDQPFWASRVHRLGVGPAPIARRRLTAERLAAAMKIAARDEKMQERAAALGRRMDAERGAIEAARWIAQKVGA